MISLLYYQLLLLIKGVITFCALDYSVLCTGIFMSLFNPLYVYTLVIFDHSQVFYYYVLIIRDLSEDKIVLGALINREELMCIVNNIGHGVCTATCIRTIIQH
jgi:hypothetical protein